MSFYVFFLYTERSTSLYVLNWVILGGVPNMLLSLMYINRWKKTDSKINISINPKLNKRLNGWCTEIFTRFNIVVVRKKTLFAFIIKDLRDSGCHRNLCETWLQKTTTTTWMQPLADSWLPHSAQNNTNKKQHSLFMLQHKLEVSRCRGSYRNGLQVSFHPVGDASRPAHWLIIGCLINIQSLILSHYRSSVVHISNMLDILCLMAWRLWLSHENTIHACESFHVSFHPIH